MALSATKKAPKKYLHVKHCVKKMQGRAKWVGVLYLIATVAIAVLACMQLITFDGGAIGILAFWKPFMVFAAEGNILALLKENAMPLTIALLYGVMVLVLLINVIGAFCNLGWLFKRKASKLYGFNRNMYAMDDIEQNFCSSLKAVLCVYVIIAVLAENVRINLLFAGALLGVGVFFHFLCGMLAGNTSLFTIDGGITEEKRKVRNFGAFVRNFIQILVVVGVVYFFVKSSGAITALIAALLTSGLGAITANIMALVDPGVRLVLLILTLCMICYAFGTKEFSPYGAGARGRKNFLWLSFFAFLLALGVCVYEMAFGGKPLPVDLAAIAGIALVSFIFEICLRRFPKTKEANPDEVDMETYLRSDESLMEEDEEEFPQSTELDTVAIQPQVLPPVYISMPSYGQTKKN